MRLLLISLLAISCAFIHPLQLNSFVNRFYRSHRRGGYQAYEYTTLCSTTEAVVNNEIVIDNNKTGSDCCTNNSPQVTTDSTRCHGDATTTKHPQNDVSPNNKLDCIDTNDIISSSTGRFVIDISSPTVSIEEVSDENLIRIVNLETTDDESNQLCWKCLGYRYDSETQSYNNDMVFPKWREKYPQPPDVIGITRSYGVDIDKPVRDASMNLMRSIPRDFKGGVRALEPLGFRGYKLKELTPNKTRRAQLVNWLIYYREKLFNKSIDQLRSERLDEQAQTPSEDQQLPSEINYQKLRLD